MRSFIVILCILLLAVLLWFLSGNTDSRINPEIESASQVDDENQPAVDAGTADKTVAGNTGDDNDQLVVTPRFSGDRSDNATNVPTAERIPTGNNPESVADTYLTATDLAVLYQQLLSPSNPEDDYYRYRILKECNDLRLRGIDDQLDTCESIAEHTARGSAQNQTGSDESFTAAQIAEACFDFTDRCTNLDFNNIQETPAEALQQAIQNGSVLARAANLYQLSEADPQQGREWLANALNTYPNAELLRHGAGFLRSAHRLRSQPFYGAEDASTLTLAERALDLTACRLENGCNPGGHFMLDRCNYLPGCLPWQSYEQWLFAAYAGNPDGITEILQLSQDYQQFLLNQQAESLIFPEPIETDGE